MSLDPNTQLPNTSIVVDLNAQTWYIVCVYRVHDDITS